MLSTVRSLVRITRGSFHKRNKPAHRITCRLLVVFLSKKAEVLLSVHVEMTKDHKRVKNLYIYVFLSSLGDSVGSFARSFRQFYTAVYMFETTKQCKTC